MRSRCFAHPVNAVRQPNIILAETVNYAKLLPTEPLFSPDQLALFRKKSGVNYLYSVRLSYNFSQRDSLPVYKKTIVHLYIQLLCQDFHYKVVLPGYEDAKPDPP